MVDENKKKSNFDCPVVWFAVLEAARNRRDFPLMLKALSNLERLGVRVSYEATGVQDGKR